LRLFAGEALPVLRISIRIIKDVLLLKFDAKLSHQQIVAALRISKGVVAKYVSLAEAALEQRLLSKPASARPTPCPTMAACVTPGRILPKRGSSAGSDSLHHELCRKGMTLMPLWEEYQAEYADRQTYRYTQFCEHYHAFAKRLKRSMRQVHHAGEKLFIDFAGQTVPLTDGGRAHIFVAAMGASGYSFACATARVSPPDGYSPIEGNSNGIDNQRIFLVPSVPSAIPPSG